MSDVTFKGEPVALTGKFPSIGSKIASFELTGQDLHDQALSKYDGKKLLINIFPSIDTGVCADSVRHFNEAASKLDNTAVLCISRDLPFAQARFCGAENLDNVHLLSAFRNEKFGQELGVAIQDGLLKGLFARAVIVTDADHKVKYTQLVPEITHKPDYEACLTALESI